MGERRPLSNQLGPCSLEGATVRDHPGAHRLASPATETEVDDRLKRVVDVDDALVDRLHRRETTPG